MLTPEELAKFHRALSLQREAAALRAIQIQKAEDEAVFQDALRLLMEEDSPRNQSITNTNATNNKPVTYSAVNYISSVPDPLAFSSNSRGVDSNANANVQSTNKNPKPIQTAAHQTTMQEHFLPTHKKHVDSTPDSPRVATSPDPEIDINNENADSVSSDVETPPVEPSLFVKNWVSKGGHFDRVVLSFPELYPDGNML